MIRLTGCLLALALFSGAALTALPAPGQARQALPAGAAHVSTDGPQVSARTQDVSAIVLEGTALLSSSSAGQADVYDAARVAPHAATGQGSSAGRSLLQQHASAVAAALFRALSSQNSIALHPEMDAVLRPPQPGSEDPSVFTEARRLYRAATSYRTERAVLDVDPLSLRWRLRINLDRLLEGSSR